MAEINILLLLVVAAPETYDIVCLFIEALLKMACHYLLNDITHRMQYIFGGLIIRL